MRYEDVENLTDNYWDAAANARLYNDPEMDLLWDILSRRPRHRYRPVDCVCGEQLRFLYGEYVHYYDGRYERRCPHLDTKGRL